ncbi:Stk1 family PASTA domain-containing Ser/Thr kinase [Nocardioides panacis]|uniref:non-specific serine/threonine protein kinase n=2 Tax=Nocardioides panacis TaxID=2849501 RepID=A0A975Y2G5_9ACTN|nr:Stk1 family PASTA domain-containing Ser/Thr kinase [Nocardioides panacis]
MIGRVLDGRYRVGPRIARGGMATVYEATDLRLDRVCALKVMHAGLGDDDEFAARFVREAHSAARLSHPHVVAVFDQGDDNGTLFLAMEYIPGHTLRDLIRKEAPMAPAKALAVLDPVLSALAAAHQAGMIHRDVKPENVLLADDGRVKVADFGLARAISAETQHTATGGVLIGTVSYLSPELVVDGRADARSDVYAAGVVLYEMLTGRKPHEGESPIQVAYKHVHEDVPPPSQVVRGLPAYVDALVARATARDRELRPADARVLLHQVRRVRAALDEHLADDPELTADLTPAGPVSRSLDDIDYVTDEDPSTGSGPRVPTILTPAQASHGGRTDDTSVFGARPVPAPRQPGAARPASRPAARPVPAPRRSRRGPLLLTLVLLLALGAGVGGWWFGAGRYVNTPGVINLSAAEARTKVQAAGLTFRVGDRAYSETVPAGSVISTDPGGGDNVLRDGTVTAVVSQGPERHEVPALRGTDLDSAQAALQDAGLGFGDATYRFSEKVAKGVVLAADPKPGTELKRDAAVDLVVSKGPQPVKVRDYTGEDADAATKALEKRGFEVDRGTEENSDSVAKGDVITQNPSSGTLFKGDKVELVVSKGPVLVEVPKVEGMGTAAATQTLLGLGFEVKTEKTQYYVGLEYVVNQGPTAGDKAPKGSTVTIYIV